MNHHRGTQLRAKIVLEGVAMYIFFKHFYGPSMVTTGGEFKAVRLFRVISEDSAEQHSLDDSSAFLIEDAQCVKYSLVPSMQWHQDCDMNFFSRSAGHWCQITCWYIGSPSAGHWCQITCWYIGSPRQ